MPGNKLYKLSLLIDTLKGYYSFGDFAQFKYNLSESDNSLVEAKTLFEYSQYSLALQALEKSDTYFKKALPNLSRAQKNGKNIADNLRLLSFASDKHTEVLLKLKQEVPKSFLWADEKKTPVRLELWKKIDQSIAIRIKAYR